ncbi:hypothetical protein BC936DRAFT_144073 [Jimgerdemannia flammicorona]|uniref:Uncharacterized protein n=1 Tax=Jimgerdemannia flammicorona TaxID=994334 RepID=A0A433DD19_9FUNG|nr:hypothetical protein BC936DRAFT_144073 [Jimgerdemannia flammicorona]
MHRSKYQISNKQAVRIDGSDDDDEESLSTQVSIMNDGGWFLPSGKNVANIFETYRKLAGLKDLPSFCSSLHWNT